MNKFKKLKEKLKKNKRFPFALLALFLFLHNHAQQKITFKKENTLFVFYKAGNLADSLINENYKKNQFIFMVPDSLKKRYVINSANGLFLFNNQDSLIFLKYSKGLQYQLMFDNETDYYKTSSKNINKLKSQINGVCNTPTNQIKIELVDLKTEKIILTNFYYLKN